ncbi:MAG: MMPL family transporter, partial [Nocardia sp.]|nr:MMPL family transporter [Nocardia sp.]
MFGELNRWADMVLRRRYLVIAAFAAGLLALGWYGLGLGAHLGSGGWDDPSSESVRAAYLHQETFGSDHSADVILLYHAPAGKTIDDKAFAAPIVAALNALPDRFPQQIDRVNGAYWPTRTGTTLPEVFGSKDHRHAFASIAIHGTDPTEQMRNFRTVAHAFD